MDFNLQKFLIENRLTKRSVIKEDDNTGAMLKADSEQEEMSNEEMFGDEEDNWYKDDSEEFEEEPTPEDTDDEFKASKSEEVIEKQTELKKLEDQKDALLMQLKSNIITLNQYKVAIGNIPTKIKELRADIEKAMNVSVDDQEPEL